MKTSLTVLALICTVGIVIIQTQVAFAQSGSITVQVDKPGAPIPKNTLRPLF